MPKKVKFKSLDIESDCQKPCFDVNESVYTKISLHANSTLKNLRFRAEINCGAACIGTMLSEDAFDVEAGKSYELQACFDLSHLVNGHYRFDLLVYELNEYGGETAYDRVENAFAIEITNNNEKIIWLHKHWGHLRLHNIEIRTING